MLEGTGWRPGPLTPLMTYHPSNGLSDQAFHCFLAAGATEEGPPSDPTEASHVGWLPVGQVLEELRARRVVDGLSLSALCWCAAFGYFGQ